MSEHSTTDMIGSVLDKNPEQFRTAFNDIMVDKITSALELKRQEVAQNMFVASEEEQEVSDETDTNTDSTEDENGQDTETNA